MTRPKLISSAKWFFLLSIGFEQQKTIFATDKTVNTMYSLILNENLIAEWVLGCPKSPNPLD